MLKRAKIIVQSVVQVYSILITAELGAARSRLVSLGLRDLNLWSGKIDEHKLSFRGLFPAEM